VSGACEDNFKFILWALFNLMKRLLHTDMYAEKEDMSGPGEHEITNLEVLLRVRR
jgi:hypothetical protein